MLAFSRLMWSNGFRIQRIRLVFRDIKSWAWRSAREIRDDVSLFTDSRIQFCANYGSINLSSVFFVFFFSKRAKRSESKRSDGYRRIKSAYVASTFSFAGYFFFFNISTRGESVDSPGEIAGLKTSSATTWRLIFSWRNKKKPYFAEIYFQNLRNERNEKYRDYEIAPEWKKK